jgi:hypothetical protein
MKKRFIFCICLISAVTALVGFMGCDIASGGNGGGGNEQKGSLELNFDISNVQNRTIVPDLDMTVAAYDVYGSGPGTASFEYLEITESSLTVDSLIVGTWLITVEAKNADGVIIADGTSSPLEITGENTTDATVIVDPLDGEGTFNLTVSWDPVDFPGSSPEITATLTPVEGSPLELIFTDGTNSKYHTGTYTRGYYDLNISATAGSYTSYFYEAVRIIAGQTTSALINIENQEGELILEIISDLENPIEIGFDGVVDPLILGSEMTVTAVTLPSNVETYQWMLNYSPLAGETGPSVTLGSDLEVGTYTLTVRVTLGNIISSESVTFEVAESMAYSSVIMVYLDGDNNLESAAIDDINEMEAVDLSATDIKIIALVDRISGYNTSNGDWTNTRLYEIEYDPNGYDSTIISTRIGGMGLTITGTEELNMGDPATLSTFVDFCKTNYPANNYALILWNHGGGWRYSNKELIKAVCWDDSNGGDNLYTQEVKNALTGKGLSFIGFDACLMSMAEVAYELRSCADIMVASEEVEPGDGWDYVGLLNQYRISDLSMNALSEAIVDSYASFYSSSSTTLAAIDLVNFNSLISALDTFNTALMSTDLATINTARNNAQDFYESDYIDLYDFADQLALTSAGDVKTAINNIVLYNWSHSSLNGHGISIYYPTGSIDPAYLTEIEFSADTNWDEFLDYVNTVAPDSYEPDDTAAEANVIISGETQLHNFHVAGDNDWMRISVDTGDSYVFETSAAGSSTDTYMYLYDTDGTTVLEYDDDGGSGLFSLISYTFSDAGTYYIMVRPYSSSYVGTQYNINVSPTAEPADPTAFIINQINYVTGGDLSGNILIYEYGEYNFFVAALNALGVSYTQASTQTQFQDYYPTQNWDLIIFYEYGNTVEAGSYTLLEDYVQNSGKLIFFYWNVDAELSQPLYELIGIDTASGVTEITSIQNENLYAWQASHPIFTTPNSIAFPLSFQDIGYNDDGDKVYAHAGGTALAGFTSTTSAGNCAIIESNGGNVLINTFAFDCVQNSLYRDNIRKNGNKNQ